MDVVDKLYLAAVTTVLLFMVGYLVGLIIGDKDV